MKKILTLILALLLLLLCLASCDSLKHEHITGDWKYNEYGHWQPITCSLNTCHIEEAPISDHVDNNTDNICDICGYTQIVSVKYNNINIEALKTLSQVSQIISIHISTVSELGVEPEPDVPLDSNNSQSDYVTIGTAASDEMPPYAISCNIPTIYSTDNADIPIVLNFGLIEGCYIETEQYSKIMLRAENGKNQIIAIKFINIEEILSSEYAVKSIWDENRERIIGFDYSHTESIVLPLSLFSGTSGQIHIGLYECSSTDKETMKLGSGAYIVLSYTRNESSISISAEAVR